MKTIFLLAIHLFVSSLYSQPPTVTAKQLDELDRAPSLTHALGYDRILKWLFLAGQPGNGRLRIELLDQAIRKGIADRSALPLIRADLLRGDDELRDAIIRLLLHANHSPADARTFLDACATGRGETLLRPFLDLAAGDPSAMNILRGFFLKTPEEWPDLVAGLDAALAGGTNLSASIWRQTLARASGLDEKESVDLWNRAVQGGAEARGRMLQAFRMHWMDYYPLARLLRETTVSEPGWHRRVWRDLMKKVADDPELLCEYGTRLQQAAPLHGEIRSLLEETVRRAGAEIAAGCEAGAVIPDSRHAWLCRQINPFRERYASAERRREQFRTALTRLVHESTDWADAILWHLTRPAEAAAAATRQAIRSGLADDIAAARLAAGEYPLFSAEFQEKLEALGPYDPGITAGAFRKAWNNGSLERRSILKYASAAGHLLASQDEAWSEAFKSQTEDAERLLRSLAAIAIKGDPDAAAAWLQTMLANNSLLRDNFCLWMDKNRGCQAGGLTSLHWLRRLDAQLQQGLWINQSGVSQFKTHFAAYAQTEEGWKWVRLHLAIESFAFPNILRRQLVQTLAGDPKRLWRIYDITVSMPATAGTAWTPSFCRLALAHQLPLWLLREVSRRNPAAAHAAGLLWDALLEPGSSVLETLRQSVILHAAPSDLRHLHALALDFACHAPAGWNIWKPLAQQAFPDWKQKTDEQLRMLSSSLIEKGGLTGDLLQKVLQDQTLAESWRRGILRAVKFQDNAYVLADILLRRADLRAEWAKIAQQTLDREPCLMRQMVESLARQRAGESGARAAVERLRCGMAGQIVHDRIFFEQILADRQAGFRQEAARQAELILGKRVVAGWVNSQSNPQQTKKKESS
ncbi:MAG: hypothetical protein PHV34_08475 [Verrucomicrobiae bacterium]|nr:hypothetical protein [Verrucomicrobiae bacterium]